MAQTESSKTEELKASTVRLPESLFKEAQHRAVDEGGSFNDVVNEALRRYLAPEVNNVPGA